MHYLFDIMFLRPPVPDAESIFEHIPYADKGITGNGHKISMKKLQTLLRHQNQKTTEIYLKKVDNDLSSSMMLLEKKDTQRDTQTKTGVISNG